MEGESLSLKRRGFLLVLALVEISLCSGIIFGWPALERIMTTYGVYSDRCNPNEAEPCDAQKLAFSLVYTIGVFLNTVAPVVMGYFMDRYGPKLTNMFGCTLLSIGLMLFSVSLLYDVDLFLLAFSFLGFAGPDFQLSVFHLSGLFPGYESSIMSAYSAAFPFSGVVFPLFEVLFNNGVHLGYIFGFFAVALLPLFVLGFIYYPHYTLGSNAKAETATDNLHLITLDSASDIKNAPLIVQLRKIDLHLVGLFLSVQALRINIYIGTVNDRFDTDSIYITAFSYIWPFGFIFVPPVGWLLDKKGPVVSLTVILLACIFSGVLSVIPDDGLQILTFLVLSFANVGTWSYLYSYVAERFGFKHYGKLLGVVCVVAGLIALLQYLFIYVTIEFFSGNYSYINAMLTLLSLPLLYVPYHISTLQVN